MRIVLAARPPYGKERVLDNIFSSGLLAEDLKGETISAPAVCVVERLNPINRMRVIRAGLADPGDPLTLNLIFTISSCLQC